MNLHSRKARLPIAALGACALVASGGWLTAAFATPTALTLNSGATTPVVANLGYGSTAAANTAYALKLTGSDEAVSLKVLSAPTSGQVLYNKIATNGTATTAFSEAATAADEVETLTEGGAGLTSFTLTYSGQTTGSIAAAATAATVQTALEALSNIAPGDVSVSGSAGGPYKVIFMGTLAATNVTQMTTTPTGGTGTVTAATTQAGAADTSLASLSTVASSDYIYVSGDVPGTYTLQLFQDTNSNSQLDSADERAASVVTMTVVDAGGPGATTATTDDVAPVITASTPTTVGQDVPTSLSYSKSLSLSDARGTGVTTSLKAKLAALTFFDVDGTDTSAGALAGVADSTENAVTYTAATDAITYDVGTPTEAGTLALRADLKSSSSAADNTTYGSKTVTIDSNGVSALSDPAATAVTGTVAAGTNTSTIKPGTSAVTYSATVTDATTKTDDLVYFTLTPGTHTPALTADGTLVSNTSGVKVYSVTAGSDGVASLTVTSSDTTTATTYTVGATSNAHAGVSLTATYQTAAGSTFSSTNTAIELNPTVPSSGTGSITLKGKLLDQFGGGFQPASPASTPVTVTVDENNSSYAAADVTGYSTVASDGTFSYSYVPAAAATAGQSDYVRFAIGGATSLSTTSIKWSSVTAPSAVTLTTPATGATAVTLQDRTLPDATQANAGSTLFGNTTGLVTGAVKDGANSGLAYKAVTLTGSAGVYFSTTTGGADLATTASVVSDSSGNYTGVYAFFTKSGTATITATSGAVSSTSTVTTDAAAESYKVTVNDVTGTPGSTLIVTGTVKDAFGNLVTGTNNVTLSTGTSTLGSLGATTVSTNSLGVFSTTFVTGSNSEGTATLTATLAGQVANRTAAAAWLSVAKMTIPDGVYQDTGSIAITNTATTIAATTMLIGGGKSELSGTAEPSSSVEIWAKKSGESSFSLVGNVMSETDGTWSVGTTLTKSTSFFAKSNSKLSSTVATVVYSYETMTAKALGSGKVRFTVLGVPNVKGVVNIYSGGVRLGHVATDSHGDVTTVVQSKAGTRTFQVYFVAPGTSLKGRTLTGTVK